MNANVSKTNGVKLLAVVAVLAMVVCAFAAVMPAEETEAAAGDTQYYSGTLDKVQSFSDGTNVIIDKPLTITEGGYLIIKGANITINQGVTVTIEKGGVFYLSPGDSKNPTVATVNGNIIVKSGSYLYNAATEQTVDKKTVGGMTLNGSIEVQRGGVVDNCIVKTTTTATPEESGTGEEESGAAETPETSTAPGEANNGAKGAITVAANGSIKSLGTKTTPSTFNNQNISMAVGATVDLTSKITGVTVDANVGTGVYTYGSVSLNAAESGTQEITNVSFSVTSEKIADAYYNGKAYTRAVANILDLSGSLGAYTDATINANKVVDTKGDVTAIYMKAYDQDKASAVEIMGTVAITDSFDVNANTSLTVAKYAIVNISGSVDVAGTASGENVGKATLTLKGILNVSGQVTIDSVKEGDKDQTVVLTDDTDTIRLAYLNIIGEGEISIEDFEIDTSTWANAPRGVNGVTYTDKDGVFHITNLDKAIAGATAANNDDMITIWGYSTERTGAGAEYTNPYIISASISIPEGLTVNIDGYVIIAEGATVTVPESASLDTNITTKGAPTGYLIVEGELMDYTMAADDSGFTLTADVRTIDADETYYLYTSLKAALANANEGDTVEIYGDNTETQATVDIEGNVTIKSGVTVDAAGNKILVKNNATLTIDGVLDLTEANSAMEIKEKVGNNSAGSVVLNNMILVTDIDNTGITGSVPGFYVTGTVGDYDAGTQYIMAPAVAAANSATLDEVTVKGDVSYSGDLTFTAGEDNDAPVIEITGSKVSISKIILDGYSVSMAATGIEFTGTIEATTTAGASSVTFSKVANYTVGVNTDDSGETPVTTLVIGKKDPQQAVPGSITIATGTVEMGSSFGFGANRNNTLTVASGATLEIPDSYNITLKKPTGDNARFDYSAVIVDGTLVLDSNTKWAAEDSAKDVVVNGTLSITANVEIVDGMKVIVNGTLAVSEVEDDEGLLTVTGDLIVGSATETLGANGTVTGPVNIATENYITVYAGSSVETAKLNVSATSGESDAVATEFFINGTLYMTVYAYGEVAMVDNFFAGFDGFEIVGYDTDNAVKAENWFTTADYQKGTALDANAAVGAEGYEAVYFKAPALNGYVTYSVGSQISLYVDGVKVTSGTTVPLSVGIHTVTATVNPGYTGDVTITFNGQTITGGTFEVTPEMNETTTADDGIVLSVTGNISVDTGSTGGDDGMGLTEILLVILVILIVVMAIMVALRLMRS